MKNIYKDAYNAAHVFSMYNKKSFSISQRCGCFYCLKTFSSDEIDEYVDEKDENDENGTALCPYCDIDSVIGEASGYPPTRLFLLGMYDSWFSMRGREDVQTPLGKVRLFLDGRPERFSYCFEEKQNNQTVRMLYLYDSDHQEHTLKIQIQNQTVTGHGESGNDVETLSLHDQGICETLACTASFGTERLDYQGNYIPNGMKLLMDEKTERQVFCFGISWDEDSERNRILVKQAADPIQTWKQYRRTDADEQFEEKWNHGFREKALEEYRKSDRI